MPVGKDTFHPANDMMEHCETGFDYGYERVTPRILGKYINAIDCGWTATEAERALIGLPDDEALDHDTLLQRRSAWGYVQEILHTPSPHIAYVGTNTSEGYKLSQAANKLIPSGIRKKSGWYRIGFEADVVQKTFPSVVCTITPYTPSELHRITTELPKYQVRVTWPNDTVMPIAVGIH